MVCLSVCLPVRLSFISRCCIETTRRIELVFAWRFPSTNLTLCYKEICVDGVVDNIGADSTGATGNFAPVLTQELGQTLRFASVPFMAVL